MPTMKLQRRVRWQGTRREAGETVEVDDLTAARWQGVGLAFATSARGRDAATTATEPATDLLPDDFPGRAALQRAGITRLSQAREHADLTEIDGIGDATAEQISERLD